MNLGKMYRHEIRVKYNYYLSWYIPKNVKLFIIQTNWFNSTNPYGVSINDVNLHIFQSVISPLLNQLKEGKAFQISKKYLKEQNIVFLSDSELSEMTPSPSCINFVSWMKKFNFIECIDLCRYISEEVKTKRIIITKLGDEAIMVNTLIANSLEITPNFKIVGHTNKETIEDFFSWPVTEWICKPTEISLDLYYHFSKNNKENAAINEEKTKKLIKLSLLDNIKQLKISQELHEFSSVENFIKVQKKYHHIKSKFNFRFNASSGNDHEIKAKKITWVYKGKEWNFKSLDSSFVRCLFDFKKITLVENENFVIIEIASFLLCGVAPINCSSDAKKQCTLLSLKENTKYNNSVFMVVDSCSLTIKLTMEDSVRYCSFLKHWGLISITVGNSVSHYNKEFEEISKLPKECNYKIRFYDLISFINSDVFDLLSSNYDHIQICKHFLTIRIIKSNWTYEDTIFNRRFMVFNERSHKASIVNIYQLIELVSHTRF